MHKYSGKFAIRNYQLAILTLYLTYVNKKKRLILTNKPLKHSKNTTSYKHTQKQKNILTNNSNTNIYQIPIENKYISKKRGAY